MAQVEIITGKDRRREWSREQKEALLAEAFASGVNVKAFARRSDVSTSLLYKWRRTIWKAKREPAFAQVKTVADFVPALPSPAPPTPAPLSASAVELPAIEIEMRGNKVRIPGSMPPALATAVLRALVRR